MGIIFAHCHEQCDEECDGDNNCYVDQGEVKIGAYDVMIYPQETKLMRSAEQHPLMYSLNTAASALGISTSRGAAASGTPGSRTLSATHRLRPQSASWAEGFVRQTSAVVRRLQLQPKASSFAGGVLTFEAQIAKTQQRSSLMHVTPWPPPREDVYRHA
eukprot:NODE_21713_length_740_cov_3.556281.p1 GENE.NODE_21713_length_740_cov_3.556281~~NODE_21713_length_740_cov_3.556281.p1  ORF type:complete len:159 (+),score=32.63 NODE_21713_length_740_cov_3.556281:79-555(+)